MKEKDKQQIGSPHSTNPKANFWARFIVGAIAVFIIWFFVIRPGSVELSLTQQEQLLAIAREQLIASVAGEGSIDVYPPELSDRVLRDGAAFVSLTVDGALRGCMIDEFEPHEPLVANVLHNIQLAVLDDGRFASISEDEIESVRIKISVVYDVKTLRFKNSDSLVNKLAPLADGVILTIDETTAAYLPSIWETFEDPAEFLSQLCIKAGLPADRWRIEPYPTVQTYRVFEFGEPQVQSRPSLR
ncbi:AmmeMemoRadiSam system protein A [Candidatus Bipolaricaulota bacterium]